MRQAAKTLAKKTNRIVKPHPLGGFVVIGKKRLGQFNPTFIEAEESWESPSDQAVLLKDHSREVGRIVRQFAAGCGIYSHAETLGLSGDLHDSGKADPRFQAMLHDGNRRAADLCKDKRAKSVGQMPSREKREAIRIRAGYPKGGRHELHSVRLAESDGLLPADADSRDLILHLIAGHHGHCRPFAPVIEDKTAESFSFDHNGKLLTFNPNDNTISGHGLERLDSGVAERFWKLMRHFGWWGLPWLESMLRLADWAASDAAERNSSDEH
jgi:CRISPR-associated endonuclease/helicase Cas3